MSSPTSPLSMRRNANRTASRYVVSPSFGGGMHVVDVVFGGDGVVAAAIRSAARPSERGIGVTSPIHSPASFGVSTGRTRMRR